MVQYHLCIEKVHSIKEFCVWEWRLEREKKKLNPGLLAELEQQTTKNSGQGKLI